MVLEFISCWMYLSFETKKPPWQVVFRRLVNPGRFSNRGNSLVRDMSPNLSFQCSLSKATTSRTLDTSLAHSVYQWPLPVALSRVFSGWTQVDSYRKGAAVGLNGGFVHTVQLGANCLPGTECQAWNEINAAITAE